MSVTVLQWAALEAALVAAVAGVSNPPLTAQLADADATPPTYPFGTLKRSILNPIGTGERRKEAIDGDSDHILVVDRQWFEVGYSIQTFTDNRTGQEAAAALLGRILTRFRQDTVLAELRVAGVIRLFDIGPAQDLSGQTKVTWQAQAQAQVRFYAFDEVGQVIGVFKTAQVAGSPPINLSLEAP